MVIIGLSLVEPEDACRHAKRYQLSTCRVSRRRGTWQPHVVIGADDVPQFISGIVRRRGRWPRKGHRFVPLLCGARVHARPLPSFTGPEPLRFGGTKPPAGAAAWAAPLPST